MRAPSGVVTFLFTDIEGSTRRWEADPDGMHGALEKHDQVLRQAVTAHGGALFKHTGDGVCAAFSSPRAAVDAAIAAQRSLELPVRMGIATGEAEQRGGDYFGAVLNRAARVMSAGHGGQLLLDGATANLLNGVELRPLGARQLRDIADAVQLFQVRAPGLCDDFPPLRSADHAAGNLRLPPGELIGRAHDTAQVRASIRDHRLVTLTGVGGVGKTRLALEVAASARADFPDGVWVIELASVGDPSAVPESVAAALGIVQQPGSSLTESIAGALEGRNRLLLFDNCEHVLDAAADVIEAIITASETISVLATSREALQLTDERVHPVSSLDVRAGAESDAVALFVQRANAAGNQATIDGIEEIVVDICRRLDGIPLAIELAASRMQSMTVAEVRDRLDDRFRLLVGSRRGLERHQTLRQAVKWSFDLLDESERALLQRCAVFAGGFDLAAACAVGCADEYDAMDQLDSLVRKSLLVADRTAQRTRFSMLETVRQFAEEQLADAGLAFEARLAHATYFASRESSVLEVWNGPQQRDAYAWFNVELANLRTAFRWSADHGELDGAAAIAVYATFLGWWTDQHEPISWAEELVESARIVAHPRLAQLYVMAAQCFAAGRVGESIRYAEAAMAAITSGRFDTVPFLFDASVGGAYMATGRMDLAVQWCESVAERSGRGHVYVSSILSLGYMMAGDFERARATSAELRTAADLTPNPEFACFALMAYALPQRTTDPAAAIQVHRRGLHIAHNTANRQLESHFATGLAQVLIEHGDSVEAFALLGLAIRNFYDSGGFSRLQAPLAALADLLDRQGCYEPGAVIAGFTDTPFARSAYPEFISAIAHLRKALGEADYNACRRRGAAMSNAAMSAYALEQIDQARTTLLQEAP